MAVQNLFWRECGTGECPHFLYFYRKLAMIAKHLALKRWLTHTGISILWLRRAIPGNLLTVIDRRNIMCAEQIWYGHVTRPINSLVWRSQTLYRTATLGIHGHTKFVLPHIYCGGQLPLANYRE